MKKLVAIILVVVLALSLGTVAMAKNADAPGQAKKADAGTDAGTAGVETTITITKTELYDIVENPNNNVFAELAKNPDFKVVLEGAEKGNTDGWTIGIEFYEDEWDEDVLEIVVTVNGELYHGNPKDNGNGKGKGNGNGGTLVGTFTWNSEDGLVVIDSYPNTNDANFIKITEAIAVYTIKVYEAEGDDEDGKVKSNNGRAHGNNDNFGEPTGNWHKDDDAADDGYSHPSGNNKDPEGYSTNGNIKNDVADDE